jgi:hypothetical protein
VRIGPRCVATAEAFAPRFVLLQNTSLDQRRPFSNQVMNLIHRFYVPSSGCVLLDGVDISEYEAR